MNEETKCLNSEHRLHAAWKQLQAKYKTFGSQKEKTQFDYSLLHFTNVLHTDSTWEKQDGL